MIMSVSFWMILILLIVYIVPTVLCLILIKKKDYKKLPAKKRYAGFWWRILAGLIDNIILAIISLALSFMGLPFIGFFIYWLYFVILQSSEKRSTLGMRVCDIKIHDEHFNKLGFWRLTGRYFATGLSGIILLIGFFMIAFTKRKQGLHDLVARTIHTID
tara:strand:+ start:104 stop:583 length:480 start_codon:yes stop_codon:yes gene_type:complete